MARPARLIGWMRAHPLAADGLLAVALLLVTVLSQRFSPPEFWPGSWLLTIALNAAGLGPIVVRRRWPWLAAAAVAGFAVAAAAGVRTEGGFWVSAIVLTYTFAASGALLPAVLAAAVMWIPTIVAGIILNQGDAPYPTSSPIYVIFTNVLIALVSFFVGRTIHGRRVYVTALEERAAAAEANQRAIAARAVADERSRIARELHDVVAHHVSVMGVLATGARRAHARDPAATDEVLGTIEDTGRTAMRELRRLLAVLRTADEETAATLAPQPGLAGVETLVDQVREAGLNVTLKVSGEPYALDSGVALAAYRIVQEALTNSLKHAGPAVAEVLLGFDDEELVVEVSDNGRGPVPGRLDMGHGLLGMRERVGLYGGHLRIGPRPGGGFRIYARIPT